MPRAEAKIWAISIFENSPPSWASLKAQLDPQIPTERLQVTLRWKHQPARHIGQSDANSSTEHSVRGKIERVEVKVGSPVVVVVISVCWHFVDQNDGNDNAVNGVRFAENDTTQIRGMTARCYLIRFLERILGALTHPPIRVEAAVQIPLEWTNEKRRIPSSSHNGKRQTTGDSNESQSVRRDMAEDLRPICTWATKQNCKPSL